MYEKKRTNDENGEKKIDKIYTKKNENITHKSMWHQVRSEDEFSFH